MCRAYPSRLAEAFGFPAVAEIVRAGLVPALNGGGARLPNAQEIEQMAGRGGGELTDSEFAKRLGADVKMVRDQFRRGGLPGARRVSSRVVMVPRRLLRVAQAYGLSQVERIGNAGLL